MTEAKVPHAMQALLELVEGERRARCDAIATQSSQAVAALLREARHAAHARLREAIQGERRRLQARLEALEAGLATEHRLVAQRQLRARLDLAWRELPRALQARWARALTRERWICSALEQAAAVLAAQGWRVVHAPGLQPGEREAMAARLRALGIVDARIEEDPALDAGLAVHQGANTVDATLRGLLADRATLDAQLSAALTPTGPGS
jgi:hypothetical protein